MKESEIVWSEIRVLHWTYRIPGLGKRVASEGPRCSQGSRRLWQSYHEHRHSPEFHPHVLGIISAPRGRYMHAMQADQAFRGPPLDSLAYLHPVQTLLLATYQTLW